MYIDELYEKKDKQGLKVELDIVNRIILDYEHMLANLLIPSKIDKISDNLSHMKNLKRKILKYLFELQ